MYERIAVVYVEFWMENSRKMFDWDVWMCGPKYIIKSGLREKIKWKCRNRWDAVEGIFNKCDDFPVLNNKNGIFLVGWT